MMTPSPPARRRGLKPLLRDEWRRAVQVASRAEAWIETPVPGDHGRGGPGRLPRGGVD